MGRVVGKSSYDYMMLYLRKLDVVANRKRTFMEMDPDNNAESVGHPPAVPKKYMSTDGLPVQLMACCCRNKYAMKRLRKKHGRYVDCAIDYNI